jgi:hypothetical protein
MTISIYLEMPCFKKKEIERLIAKGYLYQFFNKERQLEQKGKQVCTFYDELPKIR